MTSRALTRAVSGSSVAGLFAPRALSAAGPQSCAGSNAAELEIYVKLGMKPMDAILTATRNAAQALKMEKDLGTLEAGKYADLIAVDGDPLKNIRCLQEKKNIKIVMKEGRIYADRRPGQAKNVVNVKPGDWKIIDYL